MFMPFANTSATENPPSAEEKPSTDDLGDLKQQLAEMQNKLNELAKK
jgi:polyhydroxyalkanoate synthesis regulator protein